MSKLTDGYPTIISLGGITKLYMKAATPPGVDGGGAIDTTLMANVMWRTSSAKGLSSVSPVSATVAYDPACYDEIIAVVNVNKLITVTFPDTHTLQFYGWLNKFTPGECAEGEQPTAEIEIIASNIHSSTGVETAPVYA